MCIDQRKRNHSARKGTTVCRVDEVLWASKFIFEVSIRFNWRQGLGMMVDVNVFLSQYVSSLFGNWGKVSR